MAAACVLVAAAYVGYFTWLAAAGRFRPVDFEAFYTGAALLRQGHGARLYDLGLQEQYQLEVFGRLPLGGHVLPFVSPPHVAVALLPLAHLPPGAALGVWTVLQLLLAAWLARECTRGSASLAERVAVVGALAACPMLFVTLYKGQLTLLVLVGLLVWLRALDRGRDATAAAALLLGTVKPQMILVPLVVTACLRRGRTLLLFAGGTLVLAAVAAVVVGPASLGAFVEATRRLDATVDRGIVYPAYMYNLKGALTLLGARPAVISALTWAGLLGALVAAGALGWRRPEPDPARPLRLALALLLGIFLSPHLYNYDALLLVAVALLFDAHLRRFAPGWRAVLLVTAYAVPVLFLERARIDLGGPAVRWPAVLMVGWGLVMALELVRTSPRRAS